MSDHQLPDDVDQWPEDPHKLLGADPSMSADELKRCYVRLIKRFKPEHYPNQFRLLREAYEEILAHAVAFRSQSTTNNKVFVDNSDADLEPNAAEPGGPARSQEPYPVLRSVSPRNRGSSNEWKVLWDLMKRGEYPTAVEHLENLKAAGQRHRNFEVIDYWLSKMMHPGLQDPRALKILLKSLEKGTATYRELELIRRESKQHDAMLLDMDLASVLQKYQNADAVLQEYLPMRWEEAHRAQRFEIILNDCELLDAHYFDDLMACFFFICRALNHLYWSDEKSIRDRAQGIRGQLEDLFRPDPSLDYSLATLDRLEAITGRYRSVKSEIPELAPIWSALPFSWNNVRHGLEGQMAAWLIVSRHNIHDFCRLLDKVFRFDPGLFAAVRHCIFSIFPYRHFEADEETENEDAAEFENQVAADSIKTFLARCKDRKYQSLRDKILEFCISRNISPERVRDFIAFDDSAVAEYYRLKIDQDLARDEVLFCAYYCLQV